MGYIAERRVDYPTASPGSIFRVTTLFSDFIVRLIGPSRSREAFSKVFVNLGNISAIFIIYIEKINFFTMNLVKLINPKH